jgi:CTP:molybdopterin cytidylyltransferase MocA
VAEKLAAIILAAGFSSRMGTCKAMLPLGENTVLEQAVELFHDCGVSEVIVVTGHEAGVTAPAARKTGALAVFNPDFGLGMFSSICTGLRAISPECKGFFLLPVDIPLIRKGTVRLLVRAFEASASRLIYPVYGGDRGHPPLISTSLCQTIVQGDGSHGLRGILAAVETESPAQVRDILVPDANILFDMDTPEAYQDGLARNAVRDFPRMGECEVLIRQIYPMPDRGLAHAEKVAELAVAICDLIALTRTPPPDRELCRVCGWLHDMAKGSPGHEQEGGRRLFELGFDRAAEIVAAHRESTYLPGALVCEKEIVFLADKMVSGSSLVRVEERFQQKLDLYANDPEACAAIQRRLLGARTVLRAIEEETGSSLFDLLCRCHPEA